MYLHQVTSHMHFEFTKKSNFMQLRNNFITQRISNNHVVHISNNRTHEVDIFQIITHTHFNCIFLIYL